MPLPPYVEYSPDKESVYQPAFAKKEWSVASPTASLHFTQRLLDEITEKWFTQEKVVLHVGLGTFKNIYEEDVRDFEMHCESIEIQRDVFEKIAAYKKFGKIILAVGTTVTRTLESLIFLWPLVKEKFDWSEECRKFWDEILSPWQGGMKGGLENNPPLLKNEETIINPSYLPFSGEKNAIIPSFSISENTINFESKIFIYPGFQLQIIDELITNFHLPKSSLLMLVSAFLSIEEIKKIYTHAVKQKYRFFSFGDAMYLKKLKN